MLFLTRRLGPRVAAVSVAVAALSAFGVPRGSRVSAFGVRDAFAEPVGESPGPAVAPPRPLDTKVGYPDGANGDATVLLELIVEADGTVGRVGAVEGPEPFASVARKAAAAWKFAPAERDGKPVRARIRFEARFIGEHLLSAAEPPATPAPEAPPPPAPSTPGKPLPPPQSQPAEYKVTVRGTRAAPGGVTVSRTEARLLPGAFGD